MNKRAEQLSNRLRQLRQDIALELSLTTNRPEGWLPRMVFVEEDEYEAGFTMYEVLRIHQNGTCDVRPTEGLYIEEKNIPLAGFFASDEFVRGHSFMGYKVPRYLRL